MELYRHIIRHGISNGLKLSEDLPLSLEKLQNPGGYLTVALQEIGRYLMVELQEIVKEIKVSDEYKSFMSALYQMIDSPMANYWPTFSYWITFMEMAHVYRNGRNLNDEYLFNKNKTLSTVQKLFTINDSSAKNV